MRDILYYILSLYMYHMITVTLTDCVSLNNIKLSINTSDFFRDGVGFQEVNQIRIVGDGITNFS